MALELGLRLKTNVSLDENDVTLLATIKVDWAYHSEYALATSAADNTVKIWDLSALRDVDSAAYHEAHMNSVPSSINNVDSIEETYLGDLAKGGSLEEGLPRHGYSEGSGIGGVWSVNERHTELRWYKHLIPPSNVVSSGSAFDRSDHLIIGELSRIGHFTDVQRLRK